VLYVDTSASVKLVIEEEETAALVEHLGSADGVLVTSRVGIVELRRVGRRGGISDRADAVAATMAVIEVNPVVERIAIELDASLRSLDAIHLASALAVGDDLEGFVCYDAELARSADRLGLIVVAPSS
jgi:uncharacterized protein